MSVQSLLPCIVLAPFAMAALALLAGRFAGRATGVLMVLAAAGSFGSCLWVWGAGAHGAAASFQADWIPALNIAFALRADPFGLFFAMLVSGIGTLVGVYSLFYIPALRGGRIGNYYGALIAFMGAMLGIALADDLMLLFVFWEITSISSFILIGFWYEQDHARKGALTALQVTALGGLAMMVGFVIVGLVGGSFSISELATDPARGQALGASVLFVPALLLVLAGAFTKSAQVPFHFWLPGAMVAPTPVSTYLHAATMVKAGIFLLGRVLPVFGDAACWAPIVTTVGLVTFFLGAYQAFRETDLKAILARTTVSTLGLVTMLYGLHAADQDALQILSHAAYKGALFLVVGIVEHATHTRDLGELGGLRRKMPITFIVCVLAALSMAGLPPFFGFLAKESLYGGLLENQVLHASAGTKWLVISACVLANAFVFAVSFKIIAGVFFGDLTPKARHAHEASAGLWGPPAVLAAGALVLGLAFPITEGLVNGFSSDPQAHLHVSLVPSLEHPGPLVLSLVTITLGILIYRGRAVVGRWQQHLDVLPAMQRVWDASLDAVTWGAVAFSRRWQSGSLRWYFSGILLFFSGVTSLALVRGGLGLGDAQVDFHDLPWYGATLGVLLVAATITVMRSQTRLGAAIALTSIGFLVALLYVVYRSPDILLTQILIETVSTIFILLVLFFMPMFRKDEGPPARRVWNLGVSSAVGLVMFLLVLLCTSDQFRQPRNLAGEYLGRALEEAGGHNAVNVIIVDFRAMDTTGEITVLVVVGMCIYGLLRARRVKA